MNISKVNEIVLTGIITSSLSIFGSIFIIVFYLTHSKLKNSAFRLVLFLSISEFILWVNYFIESLLHLYKIEISNSACQLIGFNNVCFLYSSIFLTIVISYCICRSIYNPYPFFEKIEIFLIVISYILPAIIAIIPVILKYLNLIINEYGCNLKVDNKKSFFVRLSYCSYMFYIALGICLIFLIITALQIKKKKLKFKDKIVRHLICYPLILFTCYFMPSFNRSFILI